MLPVLIEAVHRIAGVVFGVQLAITRLVVEKIEVVTEAGYVVWAIVRGCEETRVGGEAAEESSLMEQGLVLLG